MDDFQGDSNLASDGGQNQWTTVAQGETVTLDYDADTGGYHASYDKSTESVCMVVISTVAAVTDSDPRELDPIYPVIDPDALDNIFTPKLGEMSRQRGEVQFVYSGCEITVTSDGNVRAVPADE